MAVRSSVASGSRRLLHHSIRLYAVSDADFHAAKDRVGTLTQDPGNDVKLKMYALYKQVKVVNQLSIYKIKVTCTTEIFYLKMV